MRKYPTNLTDSQLHLFDSILNDDRKILSKDFEFNTDTSEAMIQLAMIKLVFNRILK